MRKIVALLLVSAGGTIVQPGAKAMFYDPADAQAGVVPHVAPDAANGLRPIAFASPFPALGHVGIHYWLEAIDGTKVTESQALSLGGRFSLHLRGNTDGFLNVWANSTGAQLTPMQSQWVGYRLQAGREYVVPGDFEPVAAPREGLTVLFARSQMEQVSNLAAARAKLERISNAVGRTGAPSLVTEADDTAAGEIGTYVVNRDGNQPVAEIRVTP